VSPEPAPARPPLGPSPGGLAPGTRSQGAHAQGIHAQGIHAQGTRRRWPRWVLLGVLGVLVLAGAVVGVGTVVLRLLLGPTRYPVTVQVGTTVVELAQQVADDVPAWSAEQVLQAARRVRSPFEPSGVHDLDGLLGPGTYEVEPGERPSTLLRQMVQRFDQQAAHLGLTPATRAQGLDAYQLIIVASIVEKEGYVPENFGKVAEVIDNRLAKGMPLQMDSTVLFALHQDGGPVTPADEAVPSPYNTYLHTGLTPTPICFPSSGALRAALHPTPGPWLYFELVSPSGREAFETTYAQHLRDIALARSRGLP
jgi:UPF0755 protein